MSIDKLEDKIRDFINSGRTQRSILKDSSAWNKLCSSLDLIGDTQLAIEAYPGLVGTQDTGASYLIIYGILQTLLLQQDAAKGIGGVLDIKVKLPRELNEIRVVRNSAAGHPVFQKENGQSKSCFITRMSVSPISFQLMTVFSDDRDYEFHTISIPPLIKNQEKYLAEILEKVVVELKRRESEHRNMHKEEKLIDIFPKSLRYHFSKVLEATSYKKDYVLGKINIEVVSDALKELKEALSARGEWNERDSIGYHFELIEYPLQRLISYFSEEDHMNEKEAFIFASFIIEQVDSLKEIVVEVDEEYESEIQKG